MAKTSTLDGFVTRSAERSDLERIAAIELRANLFPWSEKQLKDSLEVHDVLIIDNAHDSPQSKAQAFLISQQVMDEVSLLHIAVDPMYQSQGVGRLLLTSWLAMLPDTASTVWLEVRESNTVAQNLYLSCGFTKTGSRKNYYRNNLADESSSNETAYIFCLNRKAN